MSALPTSPDAGYAEHSDPAALPRHPLVSVVMCVYNHAPYLDQAVRGVVTQQTDFPFELLLGEDLSRDESRAVALRLQREFPTIVRVLAWDRNVGPHRNVRTLIDSARGEFVAHCDGDDYFSDPRKLQLQADLLRRRPDVSAVFTNFTTTALVDGVWQVSGAKAFSPELGARLNGNLRGSAPCGTLRTLTSMYRASVLSALHTRGLPMEKYPFSDGFMVAEAIARGEIACIDQVCAVYRQTPQSATRSHPARNLEVVAAVRDFYERHDEYFPEIAPLDKLVLHDSNVAVCHAAYAAGDAAAYHAAYQRIEQIGARPVPLLLWALRHGVDHAWFRRLSFAGRAVVGELRAKVGRAPWSRAS